MLKYLIILLGDSSVSFCNYENKKNGGKKRKLISPKNLKKTVVFALKNNLKVNFLYPEFGLDRKYENLIEEVEHIKIVPPGAAGRYDDSITVIEAEDLKNKALIKRIGTENIILRLSRNELKKLHTYTGTLLKKFKRINLVIKDVHNFTEKDIEAYKKCLEKTASVIFKKAVTGILPEANFLTDRIILDRMNNCDAGLTHLTVAPDGRLYTCPAFYYESEANNHGEIRNDIDIANKRLLEIKYSPICRICDAYQCRRCVYLNKKMTEEINTPSWQQCRISHAEREASRNMLAGLKKMKFRGAESREIKEIDYDDPFEKAVKNKFTIEEFKNFKADEQ